MAILTDTARTANFLIAEAPLYTSRESGLVTAAVAVPVGTLLAKTSTGTATASVKMGGNTGNATISAVTVAAAGKTGTYKAVFTAATTFNVLDPAGALVATGTTGTAFNTQIGFTINVGATPMVAGDAFNIAVIITDVKYTVWASGACAGVLFEGLTAAEATGTPVPIRTVIARNASVQLSGLVFPGNQIAAIDALQAIGIAVRRH